MTECKDLNKTEFYDEYFVKCVTVHPVISTLTGRTPDRIHFRIIDGETFGRSIQDEKDNLNYNLPSKEKFWMSEKTEKDTEKCNVVAYLILSRFIWMDVIRIILR